MSHKSKIYLADVHDHMEHVMSSLDMYAAMSENLINYTFNVSFALFIAGCCEESVVDDFVFVFDVRHGL